MAGGGREGGREATEPTRFFDAATGGTMVLQLEPDGARFRILRPFGYRDPGYDDPFIVPADVASFRTDLASIPWFFAWLGTEGDSGGGRHRGDVPARRMTA